MAAQQPALSYFGKLSLASQLISAINVENGHRSPFTMENDPKVPGEMVAPEAVVAVLLQEHDVLAACYRSSDQVVETNSGTDPAFDIDVPEDERPEVKDLHALNLVVISNPDFNVPPDPNSPNPHKLTVVPEGYSYWGDVRRYEWCCALMYVHFFYGL